MEKNYVGPLHYISLLNVRITMFNHDIDNANPVKIVKKTLIETGRIKLDTLWSKLGLKINPHTCLARVNM